MCLPIYHTFTKKKTWTHLLRMSTRFDAVRIFILQQRQLDAILKKIYF